MPSSARKPEFAAIFFFPVAAAYAAILLPWSLLALLGLLTAPPGLQSPTGHAHEMLFGFALAVVAGYILGPQPRRLLYALLFLWLAARLSFLFVPVSLLAAGLNGLFVLALARLVVPRFRAAKKWRNKVVGPLIVGLCLVVLLFHGMQLADWLWLRHGLLLQGVLLLSGLMFFMGGRMIAPAVAGHLQKKELNLEARVQPRMEGAVLILMGVALLLNFMPVLWVRPLVGALLMSAALLTLIRTLRWQLWHCLERPDLLALALGYLWLAVGWLLTGLSLICDTLPLCPALPESTAVHGLTVGALGTLTLTVMARTRLHRQQGDPNAAPVIYIAVTLISVAALMRLSAGVLLPYDASLLGAAMAWAAAYLILLGVLLQLARKRKET